jgi:hypothetical protein
MERTRRRGGRARRSPVCAKCHWKPKRKRGKKLILRKGVSVWIDGANKKFPENATASFFFHSTDWSKSILSASAKQRERIVDLFDPRDWRFVRSISKTLCRLHLIVLVDLIMFTHANRFANYSHMLFFPSSILRPTSPTQTISQSQYFDISVSCMLRCHQWRYRYVYARQRGARHHAAVPHGWRHILVLPMHVNERPH